MLAMELSVASLSLLPAALPALSAAVLRTCHSSILTAPLLSPRRACHTSTASPSSTANLNTEVVATETSSGDSSNTGSGTSIADAASTKGSSHTQHTNSSTGTSSHGLAASRGGLRSYSLCRLTGLCSRTNTNIVNTNMRCPVCLMDRKDSSPLTFFPAVPIDKTVQLQMHTLPAFPGPLTPDPGPRCCDLHNHHGDVLLRNNCDHEKPQNAQNQGQERLTADRLGTLSSATTTTTTTICVTSGAGGRFSAAAPAPYFTTAAAWMKDGNSSSSSVIAPGATAGAATVATARSGSSSSSRDGPTFSSGRLGGRRTLPLPHVGWVWMDDGSSSSSVCSNSTVRALSDGAGPSSPSSSASSPPSSFSPSPSPSPSCPSPSSSPHSTHLLSPPLPVLLLPLPPTAAARLLTWFGRANGRAQGISRKFLMRTINRRVVRQMARRATIGIPIVGFFFVSRLLVRDYARVRAEGAAGRTHIAGLFSVALLCDAVDLASQALVIGGLAQAHWGLGAGLAAELLAAADRGTVAMAVASFCAGVTGELLTVLREEREADAAKAAEGTAPGAEPEVVGKGPTVVGAAGAEEEAPPPKP